MRIARWADAERGRGARPGPGGTGVLSGESAERAAAALGLAPHRVRADWDRARLAGLVELHGDVARPGWRLHAWDRDDTAALRGWVALLDAWSIAHPAPSAFAPTVVAEVVEAVPQLLSVLQLSAGPVPLGTLGDILEQRVAELRTERCEVPGAGNGTPAPATAPAERAATAALRPGEGPAMLAPPGNPAPAAQLEQTRVAPQSPGAHPPHNGQAMLTPLGNWAVWVKLEQICVAAQSPAGNIEQSAADMLRGCANLTPGPARAEYRAWLAARPVGSAVEELLEAARGEDALLRGLAFEALRVVGAPAEPAVRAVTGEPYLRPYALLWLAEQEGGDPEDSPDVLTREEATWLWVDTAAAVADHGEGQLLVHHLESAVQETVPALLREVRSVGHPRTVQVLVALAAAHPDPALAKAVRRAAFQVHTGGA
ncbi:hypothetical protein DMH02_014355 [Streptomyces sp. WAC 00631]|uniref:hypothetical protein n=1 Tax=Streptomyces sp. WAC 00631 TaxID=2203201 RepID=UPI001E3264AB|nr:hypothetical protein [Streptomyces sp. WAC 00631]MCC5034375.1 hypothetical protein [Streptomyces sp. WAC 00631]